MNDLNSILIEGTLKADPVTEKDICSFEIESIRNYLKDGDRETEKSPFTINTYNRLAKNCSDNLSKGKGVRVVGRLVVENGKVKIYAEHVEFKTERVKI